MMVQPPSSVSSITCGSKSAGTPVAFSDFSFLRSLFTTSPPMRKYPLSQYRSRDGIVQCCYQTLRIAFLVPADTRNRARCQHRLFLHVSATAGAHIGMSIKATNQKLA